MQLNSEDKVINALPTLWVVAAKHAAIDAQNRSAAAFNGNPFFSNPAHQAKIAAVQKIVEGFFTEHDGIYINHRENKGKPFSVVKVDRPVWSNMSSAKIDTVYRKPLAALGVEIVFSKQTNSYLYRIK